MYQEQVRGNIFFAKCIPDSIRCNGKLDMLINEDFVKVDGCIAHLENDSDEMNCDTTRFFGLYVFNFVAGIISFIMAEYLCIKILRQTMESGRRYLKNLL
jgi:hypothetical protein